MTLKKKQLICPNCGNDGTGDDGFEFVQELPVFRRVLAMTGNFAEAGTLYIAEAEGLDAVSLEDAHLTNCGNPSIMCNACSEIFPVPFEVAVVEDWANEEPWTHSAAKEDTRNAALECCCLGHDTDERCCPGWVHMNDPHEIEKCDDCGKYEDDDAARAAHRKECGCDWPDIAYREGDHVVSRVELDGSNSYVSMDKDAYIGIGYVGRVAPLGHAPGVAVRFPCGNDPDGILVHFWEHTNEALALISKETYEDCLSGKLCSTIQR